MPNKLLSLIVIALLAVPSYSYFIFMQEGQYKCFNEEVPKDTLIVGRFWAEQAKPNDLGGAAATPLSEKSFGVFVKVKDPLERVIYTKNHERDAKFALTSQVGGKHELCFQTNTSSWFNPYTFRFHLDVRTGSSGVDYEKVAKREHLEGMALQVKRLNDRLTDSQNEQIYQKNREAQFRNLSEDINAKVVYFAIFQIIVVLGSTAYQIRHLRNFFRKKKLV